MFDFKAKSYLTLAYQCGLLLGGEGKRRIDPNAFGEAISVMFFEAEKLGLPTTQAHVSAMLSELIRENPGKIKMMPDNTVTIEGDIDSGRMHFHLESVLSTLKAELSSIRFRAISRERNEFSETGWLKNSSIFVKFPTSFRELDNAGQCYALGQPTACVFHSMRALEPGLAALASPFGVSAQHDNWQNVIDQIESKIRELGKQQKTQQKVDDEKFFGAAVAQLYFVKNAWRNHVAHTRDNYSDDEALKIMQRSKDFIESLCARLKE